MKLDDFDALTFDCYGTLIDWESGILTALAPAARGVVDDATLLGAFSELEPQVEARRPTAPYREILTEVQRLLAVELRLDGSKLAPDALARSVGDWKPFPDTAGALRQLQRRHRLVVVSNVDHASFARTRERLGVTLDAWVLAEDVGAYKPDQRLFLRAFEVLAGLGVRRERILHVAESLYHDHVPAKALGLTTVWVDRRAGRPGGATRAPGIDVRPDLVVRSLADLAQAAAGHRRG